MKIVNLERCSAVMILFRTVSGFQQCSLREVKKRHFKGLLKFFFFRPLKAKPTFLGRINTMIQIASYINGYHIKN